MAFQFEATIVSIGMWAEESLTDNMMILFNKNAPPEIADYCFIHQPSTISTIDSEINLDSTLLINDIAYIVTAVGSAANINLQQLGHITLKFDGAGTPELPGCIHVLGPDLPKIGKGTRLVFG